ncbi:hypothetical protein HMPREF2651_02965 [Corynebacterium sp. HMSC063A05]|nr:hypothetical protein DR71_1812 [Corynebacterium sp. ATCC 6931]MBC6726598.1 hypothetical protein [Corynebacterium amycolatum]MBC6758405.1 hypothetical protein [Corynebacterium sp. LK24]OFM86242.1 hypothetical protein HMPREF2651_02965 [Corynebacterium sp. HMSC063A05]OFN07468.1 hypothetical protein HMPREF2614_07560 [Corynebacterium sp. HMSC074C11]OFR92234.1 hypothetical protein HMPREF2860_04430 [Corynebacterium sp. HMSC064E10]OFU56200.1 hypothetical protein HMPREF3122_03040 [Corynebacterium s
MPLAGLESTQKMKQWFLVSLIIAVSVLGLGFVLALPVVFYVGFALLSAWILAVASFFGFVLPPRAMPIGAVGVVIAAVVALIAPNRLVLVIAVAIAVGLGGGMIARLLLERKNRDQQARIDALPMWERDELGDVAETLRPAYRRDIDPTPVQLPHATAKIVAAVCKPLAGSTVIVSTNELRPVIAVYGSRVAVVYGPGAGVVEEESGNGEVTDSAGEERALGSSASETPEEIIAQTLPEGAKTLVFEVADGLKRPAEGRVGVTSAEPHELALFLGGGAPANGDAINGRAAHIHHKILVSLAHNGLYA